VLRQVEILIGKNGSETARVLGEDGSVYNLHSLYDPQREAESHVPAHIHKETLVFLGTGLGYHVSMTLSANPSVKRVVLVERYPELATFAARRIRYSGVQVDIVTGSSSDISSRTLPPCLDAAQLQIVPHPPSLNINPEWYTQFYACFATIGQPRHEPVRKKSLTILVLFGAYYGQKECIEGFRELGHHVAIVDYTKSESETISKLHQALVKDRPDLIFSINMRGLDTRGVIGQILVKLGIPLAIWFVDSPEFIINEAAAPLCEIASMFLWDRSYLFRVTSLGYRTFHLPLAADVALRTHAVSSTQFRSNISFVGNSLISDFLSRLAIKFPQNDANRKEMERAVTAILENRGQQLEVLEEVIAAGEVELPSQEAELFFRAYALHSATSRYRTTLLGELIPLGLTFFGDPQGWQTIFGDRISVFPYVNYFAETPAVYASSTINFNATSLQMPRAVNQRVFDVPLCGGFLLTDRQEELFEWFEKDEVAVYDGAGDLAEKAAYYLKCPLVREKITKRARTKVLRRHTYKNRMGELLELMGI
jgi:spore maturation protein CgeB